MHAIGAAPAIGCIALAGEYILGLTLQPLIVFCGPRDGDVGPTHVSGNSSVTSLGSDTESRLSSIGLSIQTTGSSEGEVEANKRAFTPVE